MKISLLILLVSSSLVSAATLNIGNVNDPNTTNGITTSNGTLLANGTGSVQVGYFSGVSDVAGASLATLVSSFNPYGNLINFGAGYGTDGAGLFQGAVSGGAVTTPYANQSLYLMITNSSAGYTALGITAATQVLIWNPGLSFPASEPFTPTINLQNGQGTLVQGGFNNYTNTFTAFGGTIAVASYNLVAIPEPSTLLLSALGVFALLRRRR